MIFALNGILDTAPLTNFFLLVKIQYVLFSISPLLYIPILYLYIKNIEDPGKFKNFKNLKHFLPAILYFAFLSPLFIETNTIKEFNLLKIEIDNYIIAYYKIVIIVFFDIILKIQAIWYFWLIYKTITIYNHKLENDFSDLKNKKLNWIKRLFIFIIVLCFIFYLVYYFVDLSEASNELFQRSIYLLLIIILGVNGLRQIEPYQEINQKTLDLLPTTSNIGSYKTEQISKETKTEMTNQLEDILVNKKLYINTDLQLTDIAAELNTTKNRISLILNEELGTNFYNYINSKRIEEAKALLVDSKYNVLTIEAIAQKSGFKSKTSFNNHFKLITGTTPSEYRKRMLQAV